MATIINSPGGERTVERAPVQSDSGAGWAVAVIILIAVILVGLFVWPGFARRAVPSAPQAPGANINVTLPNGTGGGTSGGTSGGSNGAQTQTPAQ